MGRLTAEADRQVTDLTNHFVGKERIEAAVRLAHAVAKALGQVDDPATRWQTAPPPYPQLAEDDFRWIKVHRYWIAYTVGEDGEGAIHNVLYDQADVPNRMTRPRRNHPARQE